MMSMTETARIPRVALAASAVSLAINVWRVRVCDV